VSLLDVDLDAPRRIEGITAEGLRALGEARERSADVDKAVDEMFERRERTRQELDEQVKQAAAEGEKPEEKADEDRPKPKRTLSLGGEEFHQSREVKPPEAPKPTAPQPSPEPEPKEEPPRPGKTLKLGARDDVEDEAPKPGRTMKLGLREDEEPQPEHRPPRRPRPPRPEGDDDMSGRTWLR
jgi:hypothetical protein